MNRYQPCEQMQNGLRMHGIVDTRTNKILSDSWWAFAPHRDAEIAHRNSGRDSVARGDAEDWKIFRENAAHAFSHFHRATYGLNHRDMLAMFDTTPQSMLGFFAPDDQDLSPADWRFKHIDSKLGQ